MGALRVWTLSLMVSHSNPQSNYTSLWLDNQYKAPKDTLTVHHTNGASLKEDISLRLEVVFPTGAKLVLGTQARTHL